nr:TPM domain-containing protein [Spirosomataceae bacterium]
IVKSVQPYDISEYAFKLGKQWGVGSKKNNGVVLLWAPGDRKIFIATGYGLEGAIPDAYAKRIVEQVIKPNFRELRYYQGLDQATTALIKYAKGEYKERPKNNGGEEGDALWGIIVILLIIIFVIIIIRKNRGGGSNNHSGGGWIPYTTYTGWGSSSGGWSSGGGDSGGGGFDFGGFGGGDFGGGGAGGDY